MKNNCCVIDTNLIVSAFLLKRSSVPRIGFDSIHSLGGRLAFSSETFEELKEVFLRPKFDRYLSDMERQITINFLSKNSLFVRPEKHYSLCRDKKDNKFLDVAVAGQVDYLISGEKDLLVLGNIEGIPIVKMSDFIKQELNIPI